MQEEYDSHIENDALGERVFVLPKPDSKDDFERRVGELRLLAGPVRASHGAVYQRDRSLGFWASGETPLPPDVVKKIHTTSKTA